MRNLTNTEKILYIILLILGLASFYFAYTDVGFFNGVFAKEDGYIENFTALFLFSIAVLQLIRFLKLRKQKTLFWSLGTLFFILIFIFGTGEEISWGQRIFNFETRGYFQENNLQNEMNIHNLKIGDVKINKLIFSQLLTISLAFYLLLLPFLYKKFSWVEQLVNRFAIPLPKSHHILGFIIGSIVIVSIPDAAHRKWEVYELVFSVIFFLIFLRPKNMQLFQKE